METRIPLTTAMTLDTAYHSPPSSPGSEGHASVAGEPIAKRPIYKPNHLDLAGTWLWEISCVVFSSICYVLLIVFLQHVDGSVYKSWRYSISPNAVTSIIVTIAKSSMLTVVASCLSQLKWVEGRSPKPTPLYNFQVFDEASRGPWGALEVFWRIQPGIATIGAALMIISIAIDPFAQQILAFPSHQVQATNETAFAQATHQYTNFENLESTMTVTGYPLGISSIPSSLKVALLQGMTGTYPGLEPVCTTGECDYPSFLSLGICSKCDDFTAKLNQTCEPMIGDWVLSNCTYTSSNGESLSPSTVGIVKNLNQSKAGDIDLVTSQSLADGTAIDSNATYTVFYEPWTSEAYVSTVSLLQSPWLSFIAAKYSHVGYWTPYNLTLPEERPTLTKCSFQFCEKSYPKSRFPSSHQYAKPETKQILLEGYQVVQNGMVESIALVPSDDINLPGENATYNISGMAGADLLNGLLSIFNVTYGPDGKPNSWENGPFGSNPGISASVLYTSSNITKSMEDVAECITDHMRTSDASFQIPGKAYVNSTIIEVRWPWIILPVLTTVLSTVLLVVTAMSSKRTNEILWKASMLPLLAGRLQDGEGHGLGLGSLDDVRGMENSSKRIKILIEGKDVSLMFIAQGDTKTHSP